MRTEISSLQPIKVSAVAVPLTLVGKNIYDLISEKHRDSSVENLINRGLDAHPVDYVEQAVMYANDKSSSNFKAYLGNTIDKGWAEGYQSQVVVKEDKQKAFLASRRQMPTEHLRVDADRGCKASRQNEESKFKTDENV